ncbi:hypothetical protein LTS08_006532 [Lithohypha guttulata]|uniref:Stress response RCI peptide n=1 Tax=Lithohypha guttulata TaxID=1690604 RepID=A0AAN7SZS9_9EURO|nr:hypothetical protein LTR05_005171 [Lithohypha guttulata]KAK5098399.1 hypothetical protein LTS08_006532 [Lithohypha guttulata]
MSAGDIFLGLIAIIFPPVAVWIKAGLCSAESLINILLCMLGYLPGLLHAWYIIAKNPEFEYETVPDSEANQQGGRVTYYYVSHEGRPQRQPQRQQKPNYGTQAQAPPVPQNNRPANAAGPSTSAGSSEAAAPPSYDDAVKGDHKVQRQE